eukprot:9316865-Heterocapsa_arctica.AAC.1
MLNASGSRSASSGAFFGIDLDAVVEEGPASLASGECPEDRWNDVAGHQRAPPSARGEVL